VTNRWLIETEPFDRQVSNVTCFYSFFFSTIICFDTILLWYFHKFLHPTKPCQCRKSMACIHVVTASLHTEDSYARIEAAQKKRCRFHRLKTHQTAAWLGESCKSGTGTRRNHLWWDIFSVRASRMLPRDSWNLATPEARFFVRPAGRGPAMTMRLLPGPCHEVALDATRLKASDDSSQFQGFLAWCIPASQLDEELWPS
jgi:hypothetical protein